MTNDPEARYAPECYACPIGTVSMRLQSSAPEATEHVIKAGRELLGAMRVLLEGLDTFLDTMEQRRAEASSTELRSIPIRRES